jgi:hypothetical protein
MIERDAAVRWSAHSVMASDRDGLLQLASSLGHMKMMPTGDVTPVSTASTGADAPGGGAVDGSRGVPETVMEQELERLTEPLVMALSRVASESSLHHHHHSRRSSSFSTARRTGSMSCSSGRYIAAPVSEGHLPVRPSTPPRRLHACVGVGVCRMSERAVCVQKTVSVAAVPDRNAGTEQEPAPAASSLRSMMTVVRGLRHVFGGGHSSLHTTTVMPTAVASTAGEGSHRGSSGKGLSGAGAGSLSKSIGIVQAAANMARTTVARHKLSLKVMCGAGKVYLYHCGGKLFDESKGRALERDDKLARWEYFLGDLACTPEEDSAGRRQIMVQIAAIEAVASPGAVILSAEMLEVLTRFAVHVERFDDARAAQLLSLSRVAALRTAAGLPAPGTDAAPVGTQPAAQLPSHVSARAAALFRMHVVGNVRQRIEAGHHDFISEIRHLTILFMGFPSLSHSGSRLSRSIQAVQETIMIIIKVMHAFKGTLVQFRCDEKGFLAICAFGLPGVSHANNEERGVLAALQVRLMQRTPHARVCGASVPRSCARMHCMHRAGAAAH